MNESEIDIQIKKEIDNLHNKQRVKKQIEESNNKILEAFDKIGISKDKLDLDNIKEIDYNDIIKYVKEVGKVEIEEIEIEEVEIEEIK